MRFPPGPPTVLALAALVLSSPGGLPDGLDATTLFQDDFEEERDPPWQHMEEPGPCHGILMGESARNQTAARAGAWGYQVFANQVGLPISNHAFGAYLVNDSKGYVAPLRYQVWATRDLSTNATTQAGPEFGVQVTHEYPEGYRTTTFGFQFVGSPNYPPQWRLWAANATFPDVGEWHAVHELALVGGAWYHFVLEADLTIPAYSSLWVDGPGWAEPVVVEGVNGLAIAREVKWQQNATWVHVDATSLWNTCGLGPPLSVYKARVRYDDVRLDLLGA